MLLGRDRVINQGRIGTHAIDHLRHVGKIDTPLRLERGRHQVRSFVKGVDAPVDFREEDDRIDANLRLQDRAGVFIKHFVNGEPGQPKEPIGEFPGVHVLGVHAGIPAHERLGAGVRAEIAGDVLAVKGVFQRLAGKLDGGGFQRPNLAVNRRSSGPPRRGNDGSTTKHVELAGIAAGNPIINRGRGPGGRRQQIPGRIEPDFPIDQHTAHGSDAEIFETLGKLVQLPVHFQFSHVLAIIIGIIRQVLEGERIHIQAFVGVHQHNRFILNTDHGSVHRWRTVIRGYRDRPDAFSPIRLGSIANHRLG